MLRLQKDPSDVGGLSLHFKLSGKDGALAPPEGNNGFRVHLCPVLFPLGIGAGSHCDVQEVISGQDEDFLKFCYGYRTQW